VLDNRLPAGNAEAEGRSGRRCHAACWRFALGRRRASA